MVGFSGLGAPVVAVLVAAAIGVEEGVGPAPPTVPPASAPASAARASFPCWQAELAGGYGHGVNLTRSGNTGDVRFAGALPRIGRTIRSGRPLSTCHHALFRVFAEVPVLFSFEPNRGHAIGVTFLGRYNFPSSRSVRPFVSLGAGPIHLSFDHAEQPDGLSFTLQGGAGLQMLLSPDWFALAGLDLHHISNGGLRDPNPGINDLRFTLGLGRVIGPAPPIP